MCVLLRRRERMRDKRYGLRGGLGDGQFQPVRVLLLHQGPSTVRAAPVLSDRRRLYRRVQ